jgi:hypothetical protein
VSAACGNCAATTGPFTDAGLCLTCHTIEMVGRPPSELEAANGNSSAPVEVCVPTQTLELPPLGEVLDELAGFVRRFVVMSPAQADAVALWIVHTHVFGAAAQTPYLAISSAEKRSGKTRLLEVLELLVARPWLTGRVTAAVLARKVDAERPTLLLDESDAAFKGEKEYAEALRGLLNTGHRRGGKSTVCVGQGAELSYKDFSTYSAKAIAGIGKLPDTVADRSLPIRLERRAPDEQAERFHRRDAEIEAEPLRAALASIAILVQELEDARPDLPAELDDRAQDAAEPLLAIADHAAGGWSERARRALVELHGGREIEDESSGVRLLADVQTVFGDLDRIATADLLDALHGLDEAPWADWYGRPLSARKLAEKLRPYGVHSRTVRLDDGTTPKGFLKEQFEAAWSRYLPVSPLSKRHNATTRSQSGIEADFKTPQNGDVADCKSGANPLHDWDVADVADRDAQEAAEVELERLREKGWA